MTQSETKGHSNPRELRGAQVTQVLELVSYQDGSAVSREVVKLPNGGVTIFTFDEGEGLSEHTAPFDGNAHPVKE